MIAQKRIIEIAWRLLAAAVCVIISGHAWAVDIPAGMKRLYAFSTQQDDGRDVQSALIETRNGALFGTASGGGPSTYGTVFTIRKDGTGYRVLHRFAGSQGDGRGPVSALIEGADGFLYGTTESGAVLNLGTVFKIGPDGQGYEVLRKFTTMAEGCRPHGPLRQGKDGMLFGTAITGGGSGGGILFRLGADGTDYGILHHFGNGVEDGRVPRGQLVQTSDGQFYGTTAEGGAYLLGVVFAINGDGSNYRVLHAFAGAGGGATPFAGLIEGTDGKLYGTTIAGGTGSQGVIFRLDKDGGAYEVLRHFTGLGGEGRNPYGNLVEGRNGALYGTTLGGGSGSGGIIFRLARDGRDYKILHSFSQTGDEGRGPYAGLSLSRDGVFYGTTTSGSTEKIGAVFRFSDSAK